MHKGVWRAVVTKEAGSHGWVADAQGVDGRLMGRPEEVPHDAVKALAPQQSDQGQWWGGDLCWEELHAGHG